MLPYAPLHHLLFAANLGPLVMTSANISGQPLTYRDDDARAQLADVADAFLTHNREIYRPIDDSVVFTFRDDVIPLAAAPAATPHARSSSLPVPTSPTSPRPHAVRVLATGGDLKSAVLPAQRHRGDRQRAPSATCRIPMRIGISRSRSSGCGSSLHSTRTSSRAICTRATSPAVFARQLDLPLVEVQHHHAHIASVMAEHGEVGPIIGLSCDGTGYGTDGAIWGCELLRCERGEFQRLGQLEYFPPGRRRRSRDRKPGDPPRRCCTRTAATIGEPSSNVRQTRRRAKHSTCLASNSRPT